MIAAGCLILLLILCPALAGADETQVKSIVTQDGITLTEICYEPSVGDQYISGDNLLYEIIRADGQQILAKAQGKIELPAPSWMEADAAYPVSTVTKKIGIYCTHSDESYEPSDGFYSTRERGSIYEIAEHLAQELSGRGVETCVSQNLHHPHDAGAYRRSRQTAVQLIKEFIPNCLIDLHRDGIPDPASYAVTLCGEPASKIRLLVGRGNQNAALNKEFALTIKAVADHSYPGLIKDIYLGKGAFNQDLMPCSILLECGTYTLEKERVRYSMELMADVLNRTLYGGILGSVSNVSESQAMGERAADAKPGTPDTKVKQDTGIGYGAGFLIILALIGIIGIAVLSAGSWNRGINKAKRNLHEMTGGVIGEPPRDKEDHEHS